MGKDKQSDDLEVCVAKELVGLFFETIAFLTEKIIIIALRYLYDGNEMRAANTKPPSRTIPPHISA